MITTCHPRHVVNQFFPRLTAGVFFTLPSEGPGSQMIPFRSSSSYNVVCVSKNLRDRSIISSISSILLSKSFARDDTNYRLTDSGSTVGYETDTQPSIKQSWKLESSQWILYSRCPTQEKVRSLAPKSRRPSIRFDNG